jgi:diguanylate cyclase (GGDEF)-like protein
MRDENPCHVLLVGAEGLALRGTVERLLPDGLASDAVEGAESILEAVLMSGGGGRSSNVPVILADISQELEQIEPAVRSMRKVYPRTRIVLLCEPGDEVLCRKAKAWGASDYVILPADTGALRRLLAVNAASAPVPPAPPEPAKKIASNGHAAAPAPSPVSGNAPQDHSKTMSPARLVQKVIEIPAESPGNLADTLRPPNASVESPPESASNSAPIRQGTTAQDLTLPALPLLVQAVLFNNLLQGRTDFAERAVANLQAYVKWGGALKFVRAEAGKNMPAHAHQVPVALPEQPPFGVLYVERGAGMVPSPATTAGLQQAAHWLASLLAIARRYEQLRSLAITDELSGAYNRRYFTKFMSGLLERARANRFRVTLLLFDIDDFKKYNDEFGHASGDAIIRELIKLLRSCTRPHDLVARLGGDEFAAVFWDNEAPRHPNSEHPRDALAATERFRKAVQAHQWPAACNIKGEVSVSGGLATFPWDADSLESLMTRADEALLRAKAGGKNVFLLHGESCSGGKAKQDIPETGDAETAI